MPVKPEKSLKKSNGSKGMIKPPAKSLKASNMLFQAPVKVETVAVVNHLSKQMHANLPQRSVTNPVNIEDFYGSSSQERACADLENARAELRAKSVELARSRERLDFQEDELMRTKTDLDITEQVNDSLRRSVEFLKDETRISKTEKELLETERQILSRKLIDVEVEGAEASKQVDALRDTLQRLKEDKRMSSADISLLNKQRSLLLDKLQAFESSNKALRHILREHARRAMEAEKLSEQRDALLDRLGKSDNKLSLLREELSDKDAVVAALRSQYETAKTEADTLFTHQKSLEQTKGHLQKQLRQKEADCNRMAVQIRSLESKIEQDRFEIEHLHTLVKSTKESQALELHSAIDQLKTKLVKVSKDKGQLEAENAHLLSKLTEVEATAEQIEASARHSVEKLGQSMQEKDTMLKLSKIETDKLKHTQTNLENRVLAAEAEISALRSTNAQLEATLSEVRGQLTGTRRENHELNDKLEQRGKDIIRLQHENLSENEKHQICPPSVSNFVCTNNQSEPPPALSSPSTHCNKQATSPAVSPTSCHHYQHHQLPPCEITVNKNKQHQNYQQPPNHLHQLQRNGKGTHQFQGSMCNAAGGDRLAEQAQLDANRNNARVVQLQEEKLHTERSLETTQRRVQTLEEENEDMLSKLNKSDQLNSQLSLQVEEKMREIANISRQLDTAIQDGKRSAEAQQARLANRERSSQAKVMELEAQLARSKAELSQVRRAKEEADRKFNVRLQDLRDRLEQSHVTNRSMQNYIGFLKTS